MNKEREKLLESLLTDWCWINDDSLGYGPIGFHGYSGNTVVYKLNYDYMDFYEFFLAGLIAMLAPYKFRVWQTDEYLNVIDET